MTGAMPPGGPVLTPEAYASIGAYILKFNGASAGGRELTASTAAPIVDLISDRARSSGSR